MDEMTTRSFEADLIRSHTVAPLDRRIGEARTQIATNRYTIPDQGSHSR